MQDNMLNIEANQQDFQCSPAHAMPNRGLRRAARWALLLATVTLVACATMDKADPQEQVRQRATQRWQALVAGEFSRAYNYNTPSFRAVVTPDGYRNRFGGAVNWKGAEVVRVTCPEADKCTARLRVDFKPVLSSPKSPAVSTHMDETWLLENGQWWFFQKI